MNRVEPYEANFTRDPNYNMRYLLEKLTPSTIVPEPNKYYVFVYKAKTPGITYDQNPVILCGSIFKWGFSGYNIHWNESRYYGWGEVASNLYELSEEEFNTVRNIPLAKFRTT